MKVELEFLDRHGSRVIRREFTHEGTLPLPVTGEAVSIDGRTYSILGRVFHYLRSGEGSPDVKVTLSCEPRDGR
jgi:hypothetical protein